MFRLGAIRTAGANNTARALNVGATSKFAGNITINDTTDATAPTTGSLTTAGGIGIARSLQAGGSITLAECINIQGLPDASSATSGAIVAAGGVGIGKSLFVEGTSTLTGAVSILSLIDAKSSITGSLATARGIAVGKALSTDFVSATSGSLVTSGGVAVGKALYVGSAATVIGALSILNVVDTTSAASGSIVTAGGVGVGKALHVGTSATVAKALNLLDTTDSLTAKMGALICARGIAAGKALYVDTTATIAGRTAVLDSTDATDKATASLVTAGGVGVGKTAFIGSNLNIGTEPAASIDASRRVIVCNSSTASNTRQSIYLGVALATNNSIFLSHFNVASGSTANRLEIGFYGKEDSVSVLPSGRVGVGNTSPAVPLHVSGSVKLSVCAANATAGALTSSGSTIKLNAFTMDIGLPVDSGIHAGAVGVYATSNRRKKSFIRSIAQNDAIDFVLNTEPRTFHLARSQGKPIPQIGYIAQQLRASRFGPLITSSFEHPRLQAVSPDDVENVLLVAQYERICCILHKALQDALQRIDALERVVGQ
ncbi:hypothetical protein Pcac1_g19606 [Phytophthora cactorum]|uniref:Peptidase S74 domain-containing protein n=1 Tax=Phytophthora cactorum TaxID=29920 RepID=A0A8T1F931_9STRA|nr:hypothetical protein Pcac1_g19606 [Phytophthora cactorum]KAG2966382.1 hypothetical protein PC118_g19218 [Phytophthora cactorum]